MDELQALAERLAALEADKEAAATAQRRSGFMSKFGHLFNNNEEVGDMLMSALNDAGGTDAVESATEEAINEYLIKPLGKYFSDMAKTLTRAVEDKVEEVMEGTVPAEGAPAAPPQIDLPEDVGAEPLMPPPGGGAGAPPPPAAGDMGGAPPAMDSGGAPLPDMGMPPSPDMGGAPPMPPDMSPMVSDERFKDVRPAILSDERFKEISGSIDTDEKLNALKTLCGTKELSDEDLKEIIFYKGKEEPKPTTVVSDATKKEITPPPAPAESPKPKAPKSMIESIMADMEAFGDPSTGVVSDVREKVVEKPKAPAKPPVDESDAIAKDLAEFGIGNLNSILGRRY